MNTVNMEFDFVVLCSISTFHGALSNLKNLILKFWKNMIITSLIYGH